MDITDRHYSYHNDFHLLCCDTNDRVPVSFSLTSAAGLPLALSELVISNCRVEPAPQQLNCPFALGVLLLHFRTVNPSDY